jgi:hypothetical protein
VAKKKKLLIDADLIVYRSCVAVERDVRIDEMDEETAAAVSQTVLIPTDDPSFHVLYSNFEEAWVNVELAMTRLFERFNTDDHLCALTAGRNFRYDVDPTYKGNRAETRKPLCFHRVREELEKQFNVFKHDGLEADDILGIFATRDPHTIVCSMDKDLKTIPCTLWDGKKVTKVSEAEADYYFFSQVLTGDTADGYPGCPGVGAVKAAIILDPPCKPSDLTEVRAEGMWKAVVATYEKAGLTEADALKQARLARILRNSDWDAKKKKPILWTP